LKSVILPLKLIHFVLQLIYLPFYTRHFLFAAFYLVVATTIVLCIEKYFITTNLDDANGLLREAAPAHFIVFNTLHAILRFVFWFHCRFVAALRFHRRYVSPHLQLPVHINAGGGACFQLLGQLPLLPQQS